jgi:phosphoglycolate phosphatase-like HAD superfamily hydrolase
MTSVILDLDGTLVDSVPLHVVCWHEAFVAAGRVVPTTVLHTAIGLGSTRLVRQVLGQIPSEDLAAEVIEGHRSRFVERGPGLQPTPGAVELLSDLSDRQIGFVVATSAGAEEREILTGVLNDPDVHITDSDDTDDSKPAAGPLRAAMAQLDITPGPDVLMVGDAPWDGYAAVAAGIGFIAVRSGGFADAALRDAGARQIHNDPAGLLGLL